MRARPRRQADLRRARRDARGVRGRPRRWHVPVQRMLTMGAEAIRARAEALAAAINRAAGWKADVMRGMSAVGGGSAPGSRTAHLARLGRRKTACLPRLRSKKSCAPLSRPSSPASSRTTSSSICGPFCKRTRRSCRVDPAGIARPVLRQLSITPARRCAHGRLTFQRSGSVVGDRHAFARQAGGSAEGALGSFTFCACDSGSHPRYMVRQDIINRPDRDDRCGAWSRLDRPL